MTYMLPYLIFASGMICLGLAVYAAWLTEDTRAQVEELKRLLKDTEESS